VAVATDCVLLLRASQRYARLLNDVLNLAQGEAGWGWFWPRSFLRRRLSQRDCAGQRVLVLLRMRGFTSLETVVAAVSTLQTGWAFPVALSRHI
jgi:hypothetical protein